MSGGVSWTPRVLIETRLRVLTWNLWWHFGPWEERQPAILETLREVDADVLCLQEVWEADDGRNQAADLARALGYEHVYASGVSYEFGSERIGNAVLSRWPITGSETCRLPAPPGVDELRVVLRADVDGPRGPIQAFVTHLNWRMDQSHVRVLQVGALCEFVAASRPDRSYPPIVCGDFNAEPESEEIRTMTGLAPVPVPKLMFLDAWRMAGAGPGLTFVPTANEFAALDLEPDRRLDYVFVGFARSDGAGHVVDARLAGTGRVGGILPSDHYGVVAELRY
jgi:endonuclease/exonuclease/phosphatase family metal-dependent hydrolase